MQSDYVPTGRLPSTYYAGPPPKARGARGALLLAALAVLLAIAIYFCARRPDTGRGALARGLADRGWTVYLRRGCGYCDKQRALLGPGFKKYVLYAEDGTVLGGYTKAPPLALGAIQAVPFWHNERTGEDRAGLQDAAALERMAR
jgi:hypothetical protein